MNPYSHQVGLTNAVLFSKFFADVCAASPTNLAALQEASTLAYGLGLRTTEPMALMTWPSNSADFIESRNKAFKLMGMHARAFNVRIPGAKVAVVKGTPINSTMTLIRPWSCPDSIQLSRDKHFLQVFCDATGFSKMKADSLTKDEERAALVVAAI